MSASTITAHDWGDAPEMFGPRHDFREALVLRRLLPALPGPAVLNAGSGAGSLTLKLVDAGLSVTSVNASAALCDWTRAALAARGALDGNPVAAGDLQRLDLPDAVFDAAVCAEVLEHLDDDDAALRELARVLRPGGLLLVTVPANPYRYDWTDQWAGHRRRYSVEMLEDRHARRRLPRCTGRGVGLPGDRPLSPAGVPPGPAPAARGGWGGPPTWGRPEARGPRRARRARDRFGLRRPPTRVPRPAGRRAPACRARLGRRRRPREPPAPLGGLAAGLLILGFLGFALVNGWKAVSEYDWDLDPALFTLSCLVLAVFYVMSGLGYTAIQDDMHHPGRRGA